MGDVGIRAIKDRLTKPGRNATGNNGDFRANRVALFFSARISSSNASILSGSGQKNGFCSTCDQSLISSGMSPIWVRQPRISMPNFSARYFWQSPLLQRAWRFHGRKNVHRRDNRADRIFVRRCNRHGGTENVLNRTIILRTLIGIFDQQTNAGAGSNTFKNTGENFDLIWLTTLGGIARCPV